MRLPSIRRHKPEAAGLPLRRDSKAAPRVAHWRTWALLGVISLSLGLVVTAGAMILGVWPTDRWLANSGIDLGVTLLFAPVCMLILAVIIEAVRLSFSDRPQQSAVPSRYSADDWQPGAGEG